MAKTKRARTSKKGMRNVLRDMAVSKLAKQRDTNQESAKTLENLAFSCGPTMYPRLIRTLLKHTRWTFQKARLEVCKDVSIERQKENDDDKYVEEGEVTCSRCKSKKVSKTELQTRSSDESATTFYKCVNCKKRWKC